MQSDIHLQQSLVEEVKEELKEYTSTNNAGEYIHFNVYLQSLPAKKGKNDDGHFPYVLVCLDEEEIDGYDEGSLASVYFLIGIIDANPNKQGHLDVANVLNRLSARFLKNPLVNSRYRIEFPLRKKFQTEDTYPKYFGGMSTSWKMASPQPNETEYD